MQRNGAQGYKDGRSREITTEKSQPITQGVIGRGANDFNSIMANKAPKEEMEEFPSWAGKMSVMQFLSTSSLYIVFMCCWVNNELH